MKSLFLQIKHFINKFLFSNQKEQNYYKKKEQK